MTGKAPQHVLETIADLMNVNAKKIFARKEVNLSWSSMKIPHIYKYAAPDEAVETVIANLAQEQVRQGRYRAGDCKVHAARNN